MTSPRRAVPLPIRTRSAVAIGLATLAGLVAFCWPLLVDSDWDFETGRNAPIAFAGLLVVVLAVAVAELSDGGFDSRTVAMLGVLSAMGAAVRPLGAGTAGIETVFFLLVLSGRVFGPGFGFVLGNTTLFASALLTGGVGPWLPYQMLAAALVAMGAGLLPVRLRSRPEIVALAVYGAVAGLLYGLALNLSFWPFSLGADTSLSFQPGAPVLDNLRRLVAFSLATSLGWDIGRAFTTALLVVVAGPVMLRTMRRAARRARFVDLLDDRDGRTQGQADVLYQHLDVGIGDSDATTAHVASDDSRVVRAVDADHTLATAEALEDVREP